MPAVCCLGTVQTSQRLEPGQFEDITITLVVASFAGLWVVADDDGTGSGEVSECSEENNVYQLAGTGEIHGTKFEDIDGDGIRQRLQTQLLGPSPYLSFDDSPFRDAEFDWFYLEDFEDGLFNVPGVSAVSNTPGTSLIVAGPQFYLDSVDADDGVIDGLGRDGHSLASVPDRPTAGNLGYTFTFDSQVLGSLPTHMGIVWTDGSKTVPHAVRSVRVPRGNRWVSSVPSTSVTTRLLGRQQKTASLVPFTRMGNIQLHDPRSRQ